MRGCIRVVAGRLQIHERTVDVFTLDRHLRVEFGQLLVAPAICTISEPIRSTPELTAASAASSSASLGFGGGGGTAPAVEPSPTSTVVISPSPATNRGTRRPVREDAFRSGDEDRRGIPRGCRTVALCSPSVVPTDRTGRPRRLGKSAQHRSPAVARPIADGLVPITGQRPATRFVTLLPQERHVNRTTQHAPPARQSQIFIRKAQVTHKRMSRLPGPQA